MKKRVSAELRKETGERIAYLRTIICNMTQQEFAHEIGVCRQHSISSWESGYVMPNVASCHAMVRLAKVMGYDIDLDWLRPDLIETKKNK